MELFFFKYKLKKQQNEDLLDDNMYLVGLH